MGLKARPEPQTPQGITLLHGAARLRLTWIADSIVDGTPRTVATAATSIGSRSCS